MKKLKVLLSAYACEPGKGSEPGVGWNWAKQIAKFAEVWVITRANNREIIERELQENPVEDMHFIYYDVPKWLTFWKKKERGIHIYYLLWQLGAFNIARRINKRVRFDVVHHLTFGNLWLPTFMPFLPVPFIWGPIGGGELVPIIFRRDYSLEWKVKEFIRDLLVYTLKINILFRVSCRRSILIIAKTKDTANRIPIASQYKICITTDVAVDHKNVKTIAGEKNSCQIIAVGRLDPWRGFDLLIKAFIPLAKNNERVNLIILGQGDDFWRLRKICKEHNLGDRVLLAGHVCANEYLRYMSGSSIFVNPCLKEGGVTVLFDALSYGLPVICFDIDGSAEIIDGQCGIKIKPILPAQTIKDLSDALLKLTSDTELRKQMGVAAKKRIQEEYNWDKKGELIKALYAECIKSK